MNYYSARIALVCLVPGPVPEEGYTVDIQVHVFKACGFDDAENTALEIGRSEEHAYDNQFGQRVAWRFLRIETITHLGSTLDRTAVSSRMEAWTPGSPLSTPVPIEKICSRVEYLDEAPD